jgi:hypothetical protein
MEQSVATSDLTFYKFTTPEWAEKLTSVGSARIGSLIDYRRGEYVAAISDEAEGSDPLWLGYTGELPPAVERPTIMNQVIRGGGEGIFFDRCVFQAERASPNCYVYSVALEYSDRHLKEFGGACVRIHEFEKFAKRLTAAIARRHPFGIAEGRFGMCCYRPTGRPYSERDYAIHPAWFKAARYRWQNEARLLWRVGNPEAIEPLTFDDPLLAGYCERIA